MSTLYLVLGNQLFLSHPLLTQINRETDQVIMIESSDLCHRLPYHKQKLLFMLVSMREYADYLRSLRIPIDYFDLHKETEFEEIIKIKSQKFTRFAYCEIPDKGFSNFLTDLVDKYFPVSQILPSPQFLTEKNQFISYLKNKRYKRLLMSDFYIHQRKKLNILVDKSQKPVGQKWSFDQNNRSKLPKKIAISERNLNFYSQHFQDIKILINDKFTNNSGSIWNQESWLPINHNQAVKHLRNFFQLYLVNFGDYEDALTSRFDFVFHSVLSPLLNNGLLTPMQVLIELDEFFKESCEFSIFEADNKPLPSTLKLNSLEGFIRQIIGWREWIKGMYDTQYNESLNSYNFFKAENCLPDYFWQESQLNHSELQDNLPLKLALTKTFKYGYCHHIERLMILSNWCLLNEYKPVEVYKWFASMFVDAYEWVMVPNVFGMGIFADGGIYATKPYISGSNYILKMSDYQRGDWERLWTDKFWHFLEKHQGYFRTQPRLAMLLKSRISLVQE